MERDERPVPPGTVVSGEHQELVGHVWVCPNRGHLEEIDEEDDLSPVDLTLTSLAVLAPGGR